MGKKSRNLLPPIVRPNSIAPAINLLNELSVLFGKSCEDALETNSIVSESILK